LEAVGGKHQLTNVRHLRKYLRVMRMSRILDALFPATRQKLLAAASGRLALGVREKLVCLLGFVDIRIVSSDSFGTAKEELAGIVTPHILTKERHDLEKQDYLRKFELKHVAAFGNGNNDRLLLKTVKEGGGLAIAVDNGEGCAVDALMNANLLIIGAANALNLLLEPQGCKATLRF
jgi:soluble P-type ATPase